MLMAVERKRKKRRKRNTRKRRNTRSTRSIRRRRVVLLLQLEMDKKTRSWRRMESQERWNLLLPFLLLGKIHKWIFSCLSCIYILLCVQVLKCLSCCFLVSGIWQWSRGQFGWPGEAPEGESLAFYEKGPVVSIPDVLKTRAILAFKVSTHSWCLSSPWFSFRMYKLLNPESFCFLFTDLVHSEECVSLGNWFVT